jgi:hypothetical protein
MVRKYRTLITDQVATAPCTDPVQENSPRPSAKVHLLLVTRFAL